MFGKSTFTYSRACQAEVAVGAKSKLQGLLEFGSVCQECQEWSPTTFLFTLQPMYVVTRSSWRGLHFEGRKLCRAHFCEVPQKPIFFFDSQNDFWQALKTSILNTVFYRLLRDDCGHDQTLALFLSSPSLVPPLLCWRLPEVLLLIIPSTGTSDALMLLSTLGLLHLKLWFTIWSYMLLRSFLRRVDNGVDDVVVYVVDDVQCLMLPNNEWTGRTNL